MNVVLYGATGKAGSRILHELLQRGHKVTAVGRNPASLAAHLPADVPADVPANEVVTKQDDLSNVDHTAATIAGAEVVVSAYGPPQDDTDQLVGVTERLIAAVAKAGTPRLLMVGGAGSLEVAPGVSLLASGHLPEAWLPIATSHDKALGLLQASSINWTYFSPAAFFEPGERTGKFRLGTNALIANEKGESRISMEDYAIALVDELEQPKHAPGRFTIGY